MNTTAVQLNKSARATVQDTSDVLGTGKAPVDEMAKVLAFGVKVNNSKSKALLEKDATAAQKQGYRAVVGAGKYTDYVAGTTPKAKGKDNQTPDSKAIDYILKIKGKLSKTAKKRIITLLSD